MPTQLSCLLHKSLFATALLAAAGSAFAQATIDHNKAMAGNVTPGDAPGYPITITVPGHYKLMSNLTVPAATNGIVIAAPHVTLDLNGFSVNGPGVCTRNNATREVSCTGNPGASHGVQVTAPDAHIRNGTVRGFNRGLLLDNGGRLSDLVAMHNASFGLGDAADLGVMTRMERVSASLNGGSGIFAQRALIREATVSANGLKGIEGDCGPTLVRVIDSTATDNRHEGFRGVTLQGTQAAENGLTNRGQVRSNGNNADEGGLF